jgi:SAM-dependent methyltransferase
MTFKDHFSRQAADYAKFRPSYPRELFDYLGTIAPSRQLAWDCGAGNGQAAVPLASVFDRVIATDASEKQISNAQPHERVEYHVAPAENRGVESETLDLIMVAQALHWFDLDRFYTEARRVLKPDGVLAASAYNLLHIEPVIDEVVNRYYYEVVGPFWPPERKLVEQFANLLFPFHEIDPPKFRNDGAVESQSSAWLPSNLVFDAAVHRCERQRSIGTNNRRASPRMGRFPANAEGCLAANRAYWA